MTQFRLRKTWPDNDNIFHVVNADGDTIARIAFQNHVPHWQDKWEWSMAAFQYRHRPDFEGRCATREEAMQAVKERWPAYLAEMEYDGWMERVRRERFGVHTISFFYEDEPEAALAEIEALAGCLEDTIEEARLSLLFSQLAHQEEHQRELRQRIDPVLAALDRAMWPSNRNPKPG